MIPEIRKVLFMKNLQAESYSPLYHQLMTRIRADIEQGTYLIGSKIPPEHELERLYQVSRVTVRRALAELTTEGKACWSGNRERGPLWPRPGEACR